jgi:hypothetical protein
MVDELLRHRWHYLVTLIRQFVAFFLEVNEACTIMSGGSRWVGMRTRTRVIPNQNSGDEV